MTDRDSIIFQNANRIVENRARQARRLQAEEMRARLGAIGNGIGRLLRAAQSAAATLLPISR